MSELNLEQAIENLYAAFSDVPKPKQIEGCPCCMNETERQVLLQKPLRELAAQNLRVIEFSCPWTVGEWSDLQYFLPRLCELAILDLDNFIDLDMILGRTGVKPEYQFTVSQLLALNTLLEVWWRHSLNLNAEDYPLGQAETILCCVPLLELPLEPYLEYWESRDDINALGQLAAFMRFYGEDLAAGRVWNAFLDDEHSSHPQATLRKQDSSKTMLSWLRSEAVLQRFVQLRALIQDNLRYSNTLESADLAIELWRPA